MVHLPLEKGPHKDKLQDSCQGDGRCQAVHSGVHLCLLQVPQGLLWVW